MDLLIRNGHVFDLDGDVEQPPKQDLLIRGGRIVAIAPHIAPIEGVEEFDATGQVLIPGLVNAHYHSHDVLLRGLFEQIPLDLWGYYSGPGNYPSLAGEDIHLRTLLGAADCLTNGITTLQDMVTLTGDTAAQLEEILRAYRASGIRASLGIQITDRIAAETVPYWDEIQGEAGECLRQPVNATPLQRLVEASIDRDAGDRLTWALAPSAPQRSSDSLLEWVAELAKTRDIQVFTHVYEARNQAVFARSKTEEGSLISRLERFGLLNNRLTIAHGVWIDEEELARFGAAGANFVSAPVSNLKLLNGFAPIRRYVDHGATVALGNDNCSGNDTQSLFQSMKLFALYWGLQSNAGESGAARAAFAAATLGGARALGLEGQIGALKEGYRGDVVLLDLAAAPYRPLHNTLNQIVYGETGQSIRAVVVNGSVVVRDGELTAHPAHVLKEAAEALRARLLPYLQETAARNRVLHDPVLAAWHTANAYPLPIDRYRMAPASAVCACGCAAAAPAED